MQVKKILIIEDKQDIRESVADLMRLEGFEVITASNGLTGVQVALDQIPDLIISDILMPKMDGFEVFKILQEINRTSLIPFIFLTAKTAKEDIRYGMQLGAEDYITKPFSSADLVSAVKIRLHKQEKLFNVKNEKYQALLENPHVGIFIIQGNKFIYVNQRLASILGSSVNELLEMNITEIINDKDKVMVLNAFQEINEINPNIQVRFGGKTKQNKKIILELFAKIINSHPRNSFIGTIIELPAKVKGISESARKKINPAKLTNREIEVLKNICKGLNSHEIGKLMEISNRTVDCHRTNIMNKSCSKTAADLIMFALANNYTTI